jgi:hypothetical protein
VQIVVFEDVLGIGGFSTCASVNLIDKEEQTDEAQIKKKSQNQFDSQVILSDDCRKSDGEENHDDESNDDPVEDDGDVVLADDHQEEVDGPVPKDHVAINPQKH